VSEPPITTEPFADWQRSSDSATERKTVPQSDEERDVAAVAGDSSDKYLACYRRRQAGDYLNVHWIAFFFPTIWLFYRRHWEAAVGWSLASSAYGQVLLWLLMKFPDLLDAGPLLLVFGLVPSVAGSLIAYPLFFRHVRHLQAEADRLELTGEPRVEFLKQHGNGSGWGLLAGIAFAVAAYWVATHSGDWS
jgi:hypothetical protein